MFELKETVDQVMQLLFLNQFKVLNTKQKESILFFLPNKLWIAQELKETKGALLEML